MIMILMVFTPIIQLKNIEFNISDLLFNSSVELQSNYIEFVYNEKAKSVEDNCKKIIEDNSILGAEINLIYTINVEKQFCVDYIEINLKNAVINSETSHINIVETTKKRLSEYLNIKTDNVVVYE